LPRRECAPLGEQPADVVLVQAAAEHVALVDDAGEQRALSAITFSSIVSLAMSRYTMTLRVPGLAVQLTRSSA